MQFENTSSCIISGNMRPPAGKKPAVRKNSVPAGAESIGRERAVTRRVRSLRRAGLPLKQLGREFAALVREKWRRLLCISTGAAISLTGLAALGSYCTVGVNYYYDDHLLCTVAASDDAAAIISSAMQRAGQLGVEEPEIETSAKLALRSDLVDGDEAVEAILAASPYLSRACVALLNGKELFAAADEEAANAALAAYVELHKVNDNISFNGELELKERIVRTDEILPADEIVSALEDGGVLIVMSAVELTEEVPLEHQVEEIQDDTLYVGDSVVEIEGIDGKMIVTNEQTYANGELLSSAITDSRITLEPVTEVVRVGTIPRNALLDGFSYPLTGRLSSCFGPRWGREHRGIDLAVDMDTPVAAAASGTVVTAEYKESYGNLVQIDHGYGVVTSYAHLDTIDVSVGQAVERGEVVAHSGNTGNSTGPHLHFEVINNGEYLNPLDYLI